MISGTYRTFWHIFRVYSTAFCKAGLAPLMFIIGAIYHIVITDHACMSKLQILYLYIRFRKKTRYRNEKTVTIFRLDGDVQLSLPVLCDHNTYRSRSLQVTMSPGKKSVI